MVKDVTWYPGVGADEEIARLERLVGKITAYWAQVEDGLFTIFVFAVAGTFAVGDLQPVRAVFFTFSSFEGKMRMLHNAMRQRFRDDPDTIAQWMDLRKALNDFAAIRNEIAHLIPRPKYTLNPTAKAIVRLSPPFWKPSPDEDVGLEFEQRGYSWDQLTQAIAPFWGFDRSLNIYDTSPRLSKRVDDFHLRLQSLPKAGRS